MLKKPHRIINCQKMRSNMPCSLMGPVALWENIRGGRLVLKNTTQRSTPVTGTVATQTLATGTVATPTTTTSIVATPTLAISTATEPENQPILVSVAPIHKKKWTRKSTRLVKDDEAGPSQEQEEEETEPEIITRSLSLSEL
ncbi:hypothetical protein GRJ2_003102800 [Grus japonensis]|uniref:Uncharacterized protein n=1 Tax=Grus japonensis TaxID=30415 RepID=A0ABC9Y9W1_GRUJA